MRNKGDIEMGLGDVRSSRDGLRESISSARDKSHSVSSNRVVKRRSASDLRDSTSPWIAQRKLSNPLPVRLPSSHGSGIFRRTPDRETPQLFLSSSLTRGYSAPGSPQQGHGNLPSPGLSTLVADTDEPSHTRENTANRGDSTALHGAMGPKRHTTMPVILRETLTDTEATPTPPRLHWKRRKGNDDYFSHIAISPSSPADETATPVRPSGKRRQTTRLRLNFPPPITQHFSHGWPHAGSWQDALYGYYDEDANGNGDLSGMNSATGPSKLVGRTRFQTPEAPEAPDLGSSPVSPTSPTRPERRRRTRRGKRYRQALVPPTPAGLGFVESDRWKEGQGFEDGSNWSAGNQKSRTMDIEGEDGLSRSVTRATVNEKGETTVQKRPWWAFGGGHGQQGPLRKEEAGGWRKRWRRVIFLDARVTIWVRAFNLAVAVALLGKHLKDGLFVC